MDIKGKVAIITGAASGIGQATAYALANAGVKAIGLADIDGEGLLKTAKGVQQRGAESYTDIIDVSNSWRSPNLSTCIKWKSIFKNWLTLGVYHMYIPKVISKNYLILTI